MFGYGNYNMNMLGMNSMSFGNIGMFNMGGLNIFGNLLGSSIFTNCNGSLNYDAYAGFQVGNVLMNIGGAILGRVIQEKSANSNKTLTANVEDLNGRISAVEEEKRGYDGKVKELEGKNEEAEGNINTYESELSSLKVLETKAADAKNQAFTNLQNATADNKTELQAAYDEAVKLYNEAVENRENKEEEIEAQQKIIDTNKTKIEELNGKIESCDDELGPAATRWGPW